MNISKALEGYFYDKETTFSPNTIRNYQHVLHNFAAYIGEQDISSITPQQLADYIKYLKTEYTPNRPEHSPNQGQPLSPAAIDNHWKAVRSFFNWANKVLGLPRPDLEMPRPKYKRPYVTALKEDEVRRILRACEYATVVRDGKAHRQRLPSAHRNKAIVLTLLDTGLRIGELLRIELQDIDFENGEIIVRPYSTGKKTRPRMVYLGSTARRALWLYVARFDRPHKEDKLFPLSQHAIRMILHRLSKNAEVPNLHAHKFRHTFAIWYIRNGGDVFTLQRLLGHSDLSMVNYYLDIANADIAKAHQHASAVDRWNASKRL